MTINKKSGLTDSDRVRDIIRANLCKYTRRAFESIPIPKNPIILDIGCGSGVPTIELATLCDCRIIALDHDRHQLDLIEIKLKEKGLEDKIEILHCSIDKMNFADESFDIIWSEGSIFVVGFERGLYEWRRLLKPNGYMGIHDVMGNIEEKINYITNSGCKLLDHFVLDRDVWWNEYYSPLQEKIRSMRNMRSGDPDIAAKFEKELREIEMYKKNPEEFESVFFVIKKEK